MPHLIKCPACMISGRGDDLAKIYAMRQWAENEQAKRHKAEDQRTEARSKVEQYRNALMWALDYFGTDGLTKKERARGIREIANVLTGRPSRATTYIPNEWDDSAKITGGG